MVVSPTSPTNGGAGPSSSSAHSIAHSSRPLDNDMHESAASATAYHTSGYSSFPISDAQSPPTTASTMRPSLTGFFRGSTAPGSASSIAGGPSMPRQKHVSFTHEDTEKSRLAYDALSATAKAYRVALGQLSTAASNFGAALETCARLKEARAQPYPPGPYAASNRHSLMLDGSLINSNGGGSGGSVYEASCTADVLLATSGLYYLMANQQGILAETVYRSFEVPIVHELDRYSADVEAEQESYASGMREASREIRRLEKEGVKLRKPRQRDVGRMRSHLVAMTDALDGLTARQAEHAVALLDQSRDMSGIVSQASRNLVRAEVDILDSLARKGWPGGGLDVVLDGAVDLFSRDGDDDDDDGYGNGGVPSLLGGMTNGDGIGSSSYAVVSGAGGILGSGLSGLHLGPNALNNVASDDEGEDAESRLAGEADDEDDGADDDYNIKDDDESEVSTINGNARGSSSSGGGGFFSILKGGSILSRHVDSTPSSDRRGRTPRKEQRAGPKDPEAKDDQGEDGDADVPDNDGHAPLHEHDTSTAAPKKARQQRYSRADSLSVVVDAANSASAASAYQQQHQHQHQHQYQSLDSLASDTASTHTRGASAASSSRQKTSGGTKAASRGRSRPFSPQRVSVDPQDELFSKSPEKEAEQPETSRQVGESEEVAEAGAESGGEEKGKAVQIEPSSSASVSSKSASRASSAIPTRGTQHQDADEGAHVWRQEG